MTEPTITADDVATLTGQLNQLDALADLLETQVVYAARGVVITEVVASATVLIRETLAALRQWPPVLTQFVPVPPPVDPPVGADAVERIATAEDALADGGSVDLAEVVGLSREGYEALTAEAGADEVEAVARYHNALERGLTDAEAREEGWPGQ